MQKRSLGLIETWGHIPAIEAADAGCKAAHVILAGYEEVRAGLVTIMFVGDVAAVKTAVSAGAAAAARVGKIVSCHVIARPDRQLQSLPTLPQPPSAKPAREPPPFPLEPTPETPEDRASGVGEQAAPAGKPSSTPEPKATESPRTKSGGGAVRKTRRPPKV